MFNIETLAERHRIGLYSRVSVIGYVLRTPATALACRATAATRRTHRTATTQWVQVWRARGTSCGCTHGCPTGNHIRRTAPGQVCVLSMDAATRDEQRAIGDVRTAIGIGMADSKQRLLIVEDDETLRETLSYNLAREGYEVASSGDGGEALDMARESAYDLIVLDVMLPTLDGLSICRILRKEQRTPIILLTARSGEVDRIMGLETGADDYVVKPFSLGEFLARVRAVLRRAAPEVTTRLESGDLSLDLIGRRAYRSEEELRLSHKEFDLLAALMQNVGTALSRDRLLQQVWGYDYAGDTRTVDVHIRWLREKIEVDPAQPQRIITVRGVGYRFEE